MKEQLLYFKKSDLEKQIEERTRINKEIKSVILNNTYSGKINLLKALIDSGKDCEEIWNDAREKTKERREGAFWEYTFEDYKDFIKLKEEK